MGHSDANNKTYKYKTKWMDGWICSTDKLIKITLLVKQSRSKCMQV